ncbi:hypothetical protein A2U01_0059862, partial [Trifolium medium]|nr:hypothetical protein [Trifolium medium]
NVLPFQGGESSGYGSIEKETDEESTVVSLLNGMLTQLHSIGSQLKEVVFYVKKDKSSPNE